MQAVRNWENYQDQIGVKVKCNYVYQSVCVVADEPPDEALLSALIAASSISERNLPILSITLDVDGRASIVAGRFNKDSGYTESFDMWIVRGHWRVSEVKVRLYDP